jgi:FkbM family methyltransferase
MYIDCAGMIRSGSTLQYNIVAEILDLKKLGKKLGWEHHEEFHKIKEKYEIGKVNVFKNHFLTDEIEEELKHTEGSRLVYVYRDIRDVCVSLMEKENKTFEQVFNSKVLHNAIEQYYKIINSSLKKYIQSYEVMFLNTKREIKEVARFLNVELTTDEIETIYSKISFESQKDNIEKYKENSEYISKGKQKFNANTLLHLNHIKDGGIAKYKQRLSKPQIKQLEDEFGEWLQKLGYKVENRQEEQEPLRRYYSQHGEDYLLWKFFDFKKDGFFVEVGAFDGVHLSNTYSFELEGWKGICVEPGQYFENCKKNRPNSLCVNAVCVSNDDIKEITFYEEELGLFSTIKDVDELKNKYFQSVYNARGLNFNSTNKLKVEAKTLNSILCENNAKEIDFISIDVEGSEIEVLKGIDIEKYKPRILIIEANDENHKKELIDYLCLRHNYIFARSISVNLFFVLSENDFFKLNNIQISCSIEKQLHPLGFEFTDKEYIHGLKYFNNKDITTVLKKNNQELEQKQKVIEQKNNELKEKNQELEQKQKVIEQKNNELKEKNQELEQKQKVIQEKNQELEQKQKVIEQKNNELKEKNQELEQKQKVIQEKNQELEQKQKVIEQKNNELKEKNQELEQKQKVINKLELIYEKQNYKYSCLMDSLQNISTVSVKTNPIEKYKQYKNLLYLYHELKGN